VQHRHRLINQTFHRSLISHSHDQSIAGDGSNNFSRHTETPPVIQNGLSMDRLCRDHNSRLTFAEKKSVISKPTSDQSYHSTQEPFWSRDTAFRQCDGDTTF
jgi:hypothetical protein